MKIALVVHDAAGFVGQGRYVSVLADELSTRHEVTVFANTVEGAGRAPWRTEHVRAWRRRSFTTVFTFPVGLELASGRLRGFDIRHAQGYCGRHANVVTAHICVAAYLASLREATWRTRWALRAKATAEEGFYRRYRGPIIAVSGHVARDLREYYSVAGPINVIPHGVDLARFNGEVRARYRARSRADLGMKDDDLVALYVGDLTKAHVHLRALAAAAPDVRVVVVTGSRRYRWNAPNVTFCPPVADIERYYGAADAFVFPSTYDAFGMVVLEAMACGLPAFVSDATGASGLVGGEHGLVLSLMSWVEGTAGALRDRDRLQRMGAAAAVSARRHPWSEVVRAVETIYHDVGA